MQTGDVAPLRIVFVAPFGLKHKTTVWARTLPIAQELVKMGHHATILVPPWDSPEDASQVATFGGVRVEQLSLAGGLLATIARLVKAIDDFKPHIVHIEKPRAHAGLAQWWLWQRRRLNPARKPGLKIFLDVDDWEQSWNSINHYQWLVGKFLAWQEEWGIRHADGITAASRWLEQKIATVAPHIPTLYVPNGVNALPEAPAPHIMPTIGSPTHKPQVLLFTRMVEISPKWLRAFWRSLHSQIPTAELVIAGTPVQPWLADPFHAALAGMANVHWLGYVPSHQLGDLYARATCAIFPAMPVPLQQAKCSVRLATTLLHGVPVIASAVGEQSSYGAEGAATLVSADATAEQFAHVVAEVIHRPTDQAQARAQAAERLLTRYAWSRLVAPLPAFYNSLNKQ